MSQLADVLAIRSQELLQRWIEDVRQHVAPGGESRAELVDHIPQFLEQLQTVLRGQTSQDQTSPEGGTNPVGREHGAQRFRLGFELGALVREYGLLRDLLLDLIEEEGLHVPLAEVRLLTDFVATAIAEAVEEHARQAQQLRREVQRSGAWLSTVLQSIGDAVIVTDAGGRVVFLNPVAEALTGWTGEQARGEPLPRVFPLLHEHTLAPRESPVERVLREGKAQELVSHTLLVRGDGAHVLIEDRASPLRDASGAITGVVLVFRDISEKKRQEAERERLRAQAEGERASVLEALSAQTLVAVSYQRGPELVFETANPVYRQLVGRDVVGLSAREALPELVGQQGFPANLTRVFETGEPYVVREVLVQVAQEPGGPLREGMFDLTYQPVRAPDGSVDGVLTLVIEVTDQMKLRWEAQQLAQEERTRRDFEQHLIGIVSHDLRNPLGAILLNLQVLLRRQGLDARTVQSLERMRSSTERAVRLVRDLLDFTQARLGGGLKVDRVPLDLHALARGVVEEFQVTHPGRELRLEQRGEGMGDWDSDRITQLLGNLLGNALKYSPADSPVTVRSLGGFEQMRLEVHNEGKPIAPESLERIFQPLQREVEGPGTDTAGRSVGLGLYIVEQIAQAHAGDIQVTSTGDEGTTFSVVLPRST